MTAPAQTRRAADPRLAPVGAALAGLAGCAALSVLGSDSGPVLCPLRATTGLDCPLCGATRGVKALLTGHPLKGLDHNLALVLVLPAIVWVYLSWAVPRFEVSFPAWRLDGRWLNALLVACALYGVVRNLPIDALSWLDSN